MSEDFANKQKVHVCVGISHHIGDREYMEDAWNVTRAEGFSCYGVFDGHAGNRASSFIKENLLKKITEKFSSQDFNTKRNVENNITKIYKDIDDKFFEFEQEEAANMREEDFFCSGTTAVSLIMNEGLFTFKLLLKINERQN